MNTTSTLLLPIHIDSIFYRNDIIHLLDSDKVHSINIHRSDKTSLQLSEYGACRNLFTDCLDDSIERIDIIYRKRITGSEKEFVLVQTLCSTMIFSAIGLIIGPMNATPKKYNYRIPIYGFAFGFGYSSFLIAGRERNVLTVKF